MKLNDFTLVEDAETLQTQLQRFNQTTVDYPNQQTIQALFSEQVTKTPDAIAVVADNKTLSYRELDNKSNQLSRFLIDKGLPPESLIGVMLEPSIELIICLLGILKAGAAYLPIAIDTPLARIHFILQDTQAALLIADSTDNDTLTQLQPACSQLESIIKINPQEPYPWNHFPQDAITGQHSHAKALAYVIYTSGTTGQPKGVMIEHHSVNNLVQWHRQTFNINVNSRATLYANISFDASIWEILPYLLSGATLFTLNQTQRLDVEQLIHFIQQHSITHIFVPPAICQEICRLHQGRLNNLDALLTGGDVLKDTGEVDLNIINNYGPTECTVVATSIPINDSNNHRTLPIGKPIDNTVIYITNANFQLVPEGIPGEICIGGAGVARGYLNTPDLNRAKFIASPFKAGERLYRTGDLGRWLADGNIEFLGRQDDQVKIRGFRIELGEIDNVLLSHPSVKDAVVIAKTLNAHTDDHSKVLLAYVTVFNDVEIAELRNHLKSFLPNYMIPAYISKLERFSLTANGKIDKHALPMPNKTQQCLNYFETSPASETEKQLILIWQEVLNRTGISVNDNFFDIGGHSLQVTRIIALIHQNLGIELPLPSIFKATNIRELAQIILDHAKFGIETADAPMLKLNKDVTGANNIFAFPPGTGDAIGYLQLANLLNNYNFYSFNFIETSSRLKDYTDLIMSIDIEGPYLLLGYSAGGNLAYHVAHELERQGKTVSDIIMIDSAQLEEKLNYPENEVKKTANQFIHHESMQPYLNSPMLQEKAFRIIKRYHDYLSTTLDNHTISANIHVLVAQDTKMAYYNTDPEIIPLLRHNSATTKRIVMSVNGWKKLTHGSFEIYHGLGHHNELLQSPNLQSNAKMLHKIITSTRHIEPCVSH